MMQEENVLHVDCAKVIRDYIKEVNGGGNGNVLAFKCNINLDGETKNNAVIVLMNGEFSSPSYIHFARHQHDHLKDVYYIPLRNILNTGSYFDKSKLQKDEWECKINTLLQKPKIKQDVNGIYEDMCTLHKKNQKDVCKMNEKYNTSNEDITLLRHIIHTEVQFSILKDLGKQQEIIIEDHSIKLSGINEVTEIFSMFEPCDSCRKLNMFSPENGTISFRYYAVDGHMPGNDNKPKKEILPSRLWDYKNADKNDEGSKLSFEQWQKEKTKIGSEDWKNEYVEEIKKIKEKPIFRPFKNKHAWQKFNCKEDAK